MTTRTLGTVASPFAHMLYATQAAKTKQAKAPAPAAERATPAPPSPVQRADELDAPAGRFSHLRPAVGMFAGLAPKPAAPGPEANAQPALDGRAAAKFILRAAAVARGEKASRARADTGPQGVVATGDFILAAGRKARGESA